MLIDDIPAFLRDAGATELHSQFDSIWKQKHWTAEEQLMAAVFLDAADKILRLRNSNKLPQNRRRDALEAKQWMMRDERDSIFSFVLVCEHFGFDPNWVRKKLLERSSGNGGNRDVE